MGVAGDAVKKNEIARILSGNRGRTMDLLEPIQRVETAVRMLWDEAPESPPA